MTVLTAFETRRAATATPNVARIRLWLYFTACAVYLLDRLSKIWVMGALGDFDQIVVIPGFFNLIHIRNSGAAFGMLSDAEPWVRVLFLVGASSLTMIALAYFVWKTAGNPRYGGPMLRFGLALILGGAAGNIHDRIAYGNVVDFLDFFAGSWHWYTFNIADTAISVGTGLLLLDLWRSSDRERTTNASETA
ncbi:MAG: signal peptidase II [Bryobacterales bacterium]|nr:signal peptidase II [Bryobacterales bacterium]